MSQPDRCRHKHHCVRAPGTEASHWRTFRRRTGPRENESASREALFVKGFRTACASSQWFQEDVSNKYPTVNLYGWVSAVVPGVLGTRDDEELVPLPNLD